MGSVIIVRGKHDETVQQRIRQAAADDDVVFAADAAALAEALPTAVAVGGDLSAAELALAPQLRWVHSWAAGPDVHEGIIEHPAVMTSSKGNGAVPLAEQALMLMIMLNRNTLRWLDAQRDHRWDRFTHAELAGRTALLVGLGNSGLHLAGALKALGMRVTGVRRDPSQPAPNVDRTEGPAGLLELLPDADFVVVTAPFTPHTAGMLGEAEFRAMKPSAFYVCVSRGGIADDHALEQALRTGQIAGAGLDAHSTEPLPADSPVWDLPNTIVTPHNGATTVETAARGMDIFVENVRLFVNGDRLVNVVDKNAGY